MAPETGIVPAGKSRSHKFTYTDAGYWDRMDWDIYVVSGQRISIPVWAYHDASLADATARIHWQILDPASDPITMGGTALAEWIAPDTATTWLTSTMEYTATEDTPLIFRCCAMRASGNSYAWADMPYSGGGPVIGSRIIRGMGRA